MTEHVFDGRPSRVLKTDVAVMLERTRDELTSIGRLWPRFETLVGLRGRRMYAMVDLAAGTYAACTPVKDGDDPHALGLDVGVLPGGWYLRGMIAGEPPALYARIAPAMRALRALGPKDPSRPLVEYYRRRDRVELWSPLPRQP